MNDRRLDVARVGLLLAAGAGHLAWLASVAANVGTSELARRDWWAFREAGRAALEGGALYEARPGGFPFLHPPSVAVLAAPWSGLSDGAFHALMVGLCVLGGVGVALALRPRLTDRLDLALLGAAASAPWIIGLVLGQPASVFVAAWLLGEAWRERRPLAAGLVWSVCALKPPLLLPLALYALMRRLPRALGGLALGVVVWLGLGLPLGLDVQAEWLDAIAREQGPALLSWKQHTLLATLRALLPAPAAWGVWALGALGAGALVWRRARDADGLEGLGLFALWAAVFSPYLYFYDALLLVVPLAAAVRSRRGVLLWLAALTALAEHALFFGWQAGPPLASLPALAWLLVALRRNETTAGASTLPTLGEQS